MHPAPVLAQPQIDTPEFRQLADFRFRLRSFLSFSEQAAETQGVTAQHYQLLQIVGLADDKGPPITYIAQRMLLRHNSAVELVDRAERADLVQRIHDNDDHRRALVVLTPRGREVLASLLSAHLAYLKQDGPSILQSLERVVGGC